MFFKDLIPYAKLDNFKEEFLKQRSFINIGVLAWIIGMLLMCIIFMSLMIVKVSSTAEYYQNQTAALRTRSIQSYNPDNVETTEPTVLQIDGLAEEAASTTNFVQPKSQPLRSPNHRKTAFLEEMRAKIQQQQQQQQQEQLLQQQQQQQLKLQQSLQQQQQLPHELHASAGETVYLLERADGTAVYEQPIYGTWRTKARRSQSSAAQMLGDGKPEIGAEQPFHHQTQHLYEQLPRRASTMTPIKSDLHDQIPRPPRLTSRRPSMVLRRQYLEIPINASFAQDDAKPKPFHFPHDGPLPQEFKKVEADRAEVNNIQDILQHLHLGGGPSKVPQLIMMPTGLHIAGSFKNLRSSGISNFFRNKRNKKQMQFTFPLAVPTQLLKAYQAPIFGAYQRTAMDQFYPFKPRSPNDINLLAMQQQLKTNRAKNKKKNKQKKTSASSNLMLQQYGNQRPFPIDPYMANYQQLFDLSAAQKPKLKRVPFKVNLDIFPVLPPTRDYKSSAFTLDEMKVASSARSPTMLRNPFMDYYHIPMLPSAAALAYSNPYEPPQQSFVPFRFPSAAQPQKPLPQSSNVVTFPDQQPKSQFILTSANQQTPFMPLEVVHAGPSAPNGNAQQNSKSNQIMVHLNVFPKKTAPPAQPSSNNPFHHSVHNINRQTVGDSDQLRPIEPRHQPKYANVPSSTNATNAPQQVASSRSDDGDLHPLVDFEHPIVAADMEELPQPAALVSNKLDSPDTASYYDHNEARNNFRFNENANVDQMASEAQTASLFRFPVEDLIQFQVGDAL